jgi:hypothetical protein
LSAETPKPARVVRLPFDFGETVYHRMRTDKVPGMVTGYNVGPVDVAVRVTWGDDLHEFQHYFFELTTEFEPDIT